MTFDIKNKPIVFTDNVITIIKGNGDIRKRGWRYYIVMRNSLTRQRLISGLEKALEALKNDKSIYTD